MSTQTMKAVVLKSELVVEVEDRPRPTITDDRDVIIQVHYAGLCGSDLHAYRGHEPGADFIMGHEVLGEVHETGAAVTQFKKGDLVVSPFSCSCGKCWFCSRGYASRCLHGAVYGTPNLEGCQAEYFRQPLADGSLFPIPKELRDEGFPLEVLLLLADVLPTGYCSAYNARRLLDEDREVGDAIKVVDGVAVVIGCGPVGLCAITSALTLFSSVIAVDPNPTRRALAEKHGASAYAPDDLLAAVHAATEGRGADAVLEVVGNQPALELAMTLVRRWGAISSVGVHNGTRSFSGEALFTKNVRFQFGRCNVRQHFPASLAILRANKGLFAKFVEHVVGFDEAVEFYRRFEKNEVGKTVFITDAGRAAR